MENPDIKVIQKILSGYYLYPDSLRETKGLTIFMVRGEQEKYLGAFGSRDQISGSGLTGKLSDYIETEKDDNSIIGLYNRGDKNLKILLSLIPELGPAPLGISSSFGFGDRLGIANAAHIRTIRQQKNILPVLAQQSVRELQKTGKDFKKVVSNSMWNVLQEGYRGKWGADADHIKDRENFIKAADAGMTMYTLDTSDHLAEEINYMTPEKIRHLYDLENRYIKSIKERYLDKDIFIDGEKISFDEDTVIRLALVYGKALDFVGDIYRFLSQKMDAFDYEVSFDETNTVTTPEAHYFLVNEMLETGIRFTSLALRFPGTFEKGIDYLGDIREFEESIKIHSNICRKIGGYKLSLHSGSDKLSIYPAFARHTQGVFHIKTSGTSWLEAVRVIAKVDPVFFRKLYNIAYDTFDYNKKAYHVNLDKNDLPASINSWKDESLPEKMNLPDIRRMFHIAYGSILDKENSRIFKLLFHNEDIHYKYLIGNFEKHFKSL